MTDANTEPKFNYTRETPPPARPERPGAVAPREVKEPGLETKPEAGASAVPATTEVKTADFFNVLKRKKPRPSAIPQVRDEVALRVEKILEEGIGDAYARLSPVAREEFKLKGEDTARQVRELLNAAHVKVKKIFRLILEWLKLLPGVNHFFLEQEAKIKTDKILALHERTRPR